MIPHLTAGKCVAKLRPSRGSEHVRRSGIFDFRSSGMVAKGERTYEEAMDAWRACGTEFILLVCGLGGIAFLPAGG
jgi:hypothetical protein